MGSYGITIKHESSFQDIPGHKTTCLKSATRCQTMSNRPIASTSSWLTLERVFLSFQVPLVLGLPPRPAMDSPYFNCAAAKTLVLFVGDTWTSDSCSKTWMILTKSPWLLVKSVKSPLWYLHKWYIVYSLIIWYYMMELFTQWLWVRQLQISQLSLRCFWNHDLNHPLPPL